MLAQYISARGHGLVGKAGVRALRKPPQVYMEHILARPDDISSVHARVLPVCDNGMER